MDFGRLIGTLFEHRSNRVIAVCRAVIAALFVLALWLDPAQPARAAKIGAALLSSYLVVSAILVAIAWRDWWLDHRLAKPAHALDIFVFLAALYFTETGLSDFVSPFLSFFTFLMLSANSRWGWRTTGWIAFLISLSFFLLGFELHRQGIAVDLPRFGRRLAYMLVMSLVLVWFGSQNSASRAPHMPASREGDRSVLENALTYALAVTGARGVVVAWENDEEPRTTLATATPAGRRVTFLAPGTIKPQPQRRAMLFDGRRRRQLVLAQRHRIKARTGVDLPDLARFSGIGEGLLVPIKGSSGSGELVLTGITGMGADHLKLGIEIGREIAQAMDHDRLSTVTKEAAVMRMRGSIARDLHDSLAQSLAGANFRLEALRGLVTSGADPLPEIAAIQAGLAGEQAHVRTVISRLREDEVASGNRDLAHDIALLANDLERQWGVEIEFVDHKQPIIAPPLLTFELQQLVREAVANAVRHGRATRVAVQLAREGQGLYLAITDNGSGFAANSSAAIPRSLAERVGELGGTLAISSENGHTLLVITLPLRG